METNNFLLASEGLIRRGNHHLALEMLIQYVKQQKEEIKELKECVYSLSKVLEVQNGWDHD